MICLKSRRLVGLPGGMLAGIGGVWAGSAAPGTEYRARDYPRWPNLAGLTAVRVGSDAELSATLAGFGRRYDTDTHYIRCAVGADFAAVRTISVHGSIAHPLMIAGNRLDGDFEDRAQFEQGTLMGAHIWICGLSGVGSGQDEVLNIAGAADGAIVTQWRFEARNSVLVDRREGAAPQGVAIGWNFFTGDAVDLPDNGNEHDDNIIRFELGKERGEWREHARINRNVIETHEPGPSGASACIENRPGMNPRRGPIFWRDFLVLENWIKMGRLRGAYLKHGGLPIRNYCEMTPRGMPFVFRGRGATAGAMLGNRVVGGSRINAQGERHLIKGNDFSELSTGLCVGCRFALNAEENPDSQSDGGDYAVLAGNRGTIILGTYLGTPTGKLGHVVLEANKGVVKDNRGKVVVFDRAGRPKEEVPNVDAATLIRRDSTTRRIPRLSTITREQCGPWAPEYASRFAE